MNARDTSSDDAIVGSLRPPPGTPRPHPHELDVWIAGQGLTADVARLHRPVPAAAFGQLLLSWGIIVASWLLVSSFVRSPIAWLVALIAVGTRQRALINSLHDASHVQAFGSRSLNRAISAIFLAAPLFEDYRHYRLGHLQHHVYLGNDGRDPDLVRITPEVAERGPLAMYLSVFVQGRMWSQSVLGTMETMGNAARLRGIAAMAVMLGLTWFGRGPMGALAFFVLWFGARATTFHAIRTFSEISDHVGLPQLGCPFQATRNLPRNILTRVLHPHGDCYHLTHHLFPAVPLANLAKLHELLLGYPAYARAAQCDGYFVGENSVTGGWTIALAGVNRDGGVRAE